MQDNQGLSEIIVSNWFSPFFANQYAHLFIGGPTSIKKASMLFNIHACILMGCFCNNTGDNNVFLCNIPLKNDDTTPFLAPLSMRLYRYVVNAHMHAPTLCSAVAKIKRITSVLSHGL